MESLPFLQKLTDCNFLHTYLFTQLILFLFNNFQACLLRLHNMPLSPRNKIRTDQLVCGIVALMNQLCIFFKIK